MLDRTIRSLEKILDEQDDKNIRRRCDYIKHSSKELRDIVSRSIGKLDSWVQVIGRIEGLIADVDGLSELLDTDEKTVYSGQKKTAEVVAVTVTEFMEQYCEGNLTKSVLHSRKESLFKANGRDIQLPTHIGEWKRGKPKRFDPEKLKENWPQYREYNSNLPLLK